MILKSNKIKFIAFLIFLNTNLFGNLRKHNFKNSVINIIMTGVKGFGNIDLIIPDIVKKI